MRIAAVQYSLAERAYDIFIRGCAAPHCEGCHNPELWDFDGPRVGDSFDVVTKMEDKVHMFDKIRVMGGEPLEQDPKELERLLDLIRIYYPFKELWVFTGLSTGFEMVSEYADYIKVGRYYKNLPSTTCPMTGITLASSNQKVLKFTSWRDRITR